MSNNMQCNRCAFASACKFASPSQKDCNLSVAVPYCKDCEFCKKVANDITQEILLFCTRMQNSAVGQTDFCIWGRLQFNVAKKEEAPNPKISSVPTAPKEKKQVAIYTDGACKGNPGPGGWGAILVFGNNEKELGGGEPETTNNRMELTAVIEALNLLKESCFVTLTTDSKYIVDAITKGWANNWKHNGWKKSDGKDAVNVDLWEKLLTLLKTHDVSFVWVKGHDGHPYNERCDKIACSHANKTRKKVKS